jgi:hypothetical protein
MILARRRLLAGIGATLAAPAIIRTPGLLMPVRRVPKPAFITVSAGTQEIHLPSGAPIGTHYTIKNCSGAACFIYTGSNWVAF